MTNKAPFCAFLWLTLSVLSRQIRPLPYYQVSFWSLLTYKVSLWSLPSYQVKPRNLRNPRLINDLCLYICRASSTNVMNALQIKLFLQNEPNFRKSQINLSPFITMNYEQRTMNYEVKNEPKRTQNEAKSQKGKNERNYLSNNELRTTNYELRSKKRTQFKPKQTQFHMILAYFSSRPINAANLRSVRSTCNLYYDRLLFRVDTAINHRRLP